jgi:hypothetical protein
MVIYKDELHSPLPLMDKPSSLLYSTYSPIWEEVRSIVAISFDSRRYLSIYERMSLLVVSYSHWGRRNGFESEFESMCWWYW